MIYVQNLSTGSFLSCIDKNKQPVTTPFETRAMTFDSAEAATKWMNKALKKTPSLTTKFHLVTLGEEETVSPE